MLEGSDIFIPLLSGCKPVRTKNMLTHVTSKVQLNLVHPKFLFRVNVNSGPRLLRNSKFSSFFYLKKSKNVSKIFHICNIYIHM